MRLYEGTKSELLDTCLQMVKDNLVVGSAGNASVRVNDHVIITPSSIHYTEMSSEDMLVLDLDGNVIEGDKNPSIEFKMHLELYNTRQDAKAVVHTHSLYASAMAILNEPLPPVIDETVTKLGSQIRVSEYAMPGTKDLAQNVRVAIEDRSAAFIGNHGAVCIGKTLKEALHLAVLLERTCKIYLVAKQVGTPHQLPEDVVEDEQDVWEMMRDY
jgi:L-fuculose-phosphate aldolase